MIEASFEAVVPKAINAEFEAIIPREKAFDIVNKDIHIDTNGRYEVNADAGTAMTQVNVEVEVPNNIFQEAMIDNTGSGLGNAKTVIITEGVKSIKNHFALQGSKIINVYIPETLKRIETAAFNTVHSLLYISPFPSGFESIMGQAFQYCSKLPFLDFTNVINIPTLASTNAFTGTICKFVVPDALYDQWVVATNWATYKSRIVKASEWVEPTNE